MAFEPTQPNTPLFSHELRAGLSWRLFVFLLITCTTLSLAYFGLEYGYRSFLKASIADYTKKTNAIPAQFSADAETKLVNFYSQLVNLKALLAKHVFSSNLLKFLETTTNTRVAYLDASVDLKTNALTLDGLADNYATLVSQVSFLEQQKSVDSVTLGQNSLDKGVVKFSIRVVLVPGFFGLNSTP